jgi:5-methylthioadenosine/S-adenosylhomocysteine deaminase
MRILVDAAWAAEPGGSLREGAAILIEDDRITAVAPRGELADADVDERIDGSGCLALPGLVNAHQHGRPDSTLAHGVADAPLECWLVALLAQPPAEPYADTLRLCDQMLAGGVTSAIHSHYTSATTAAEFDAELRVLLAGYRDGGVRGIVAADLRDQGQPVYGDSDRFLAELPGALRARVTELVRASVPLREALEVVAGLRDEIRVGRHGDVELIYGPPGPPWCSSPLLAAVADCDAPVHTHLHETRYEQEFGRVEYGDGTLAELARVGLLDERLSVAHGVWLDEADRAAIASAGTSVVTNPSSNLRLHAGVAPVRALLDAGVNVAIGTDNMRLGGGEQLLDELRLLGALHRRAEIDDQGIPPATLLGIASESGGRAIGRPDIGVLRPGASADVLLVDIERLARPGARVDPLAVALGTAQPADFRAVIAGGRIALHAGRSGPSPADDAVATHAPAPAAPADPAATELAEELLPYVRAHYRIREPVRA